MGVSLMSRLNDFIATTLADRQISDDELPQIRERLYADGELSQEDVKLLVELYCGCDEPSPKFSKLLFGVLEEVLLADDEISPSEQFYLLKLLYSDRVVRDSERQFLKKLRGKLSRKAPEFEALYETAMKAPDRNWSVGGR
jgi:hypothetical protein